MPKSQQGKSKARHVEPAVAHEHNEPGIQGNGKSQHRQQMTHGLRRYTTIITGFSISVLNATSNSAPSAPSTAR
jgi:hypothetical protein